MSSGINRRNFVKCAGGAAGAAALAGCAEDQGTPDSDDGGSDADGEEDGLSSGERPVQFLGILPYAYEKEEQNFEDSTGIDFQRKTVDLPTVSSQLLGGGNESFDIVATDATQMPAFIANDAAKPVDTSAVDRWSNENISDLFINPRERLSHLGAAGERFANIIWDDPETKERITHWPICHGYDAVGTNPKFIEPGSVSKWSAIFDDQYQGKAMFQANNVIGLSEALMHLLDKDQIDGARGEINNPTQDQIDAAVDFLIKEKNAGQFRKTWVAAGTATNLLTSEEAIIGDPWQPSVYAARRKGTPCQYNTMEDGIQGFRLWVGSCMPTNPGASDRNNMDEVRAWLNYKLGAWYPGFIQGNVGYSVPHWPNESLVRTGEDNTGKGMGAEFYDWAYRGKATYEAIDDPFLFNPQDYDWSFEEGSPSDSGKPRDESDIETRNNRVGYFQYFPDEGDYILKRWQDFTSA
jgi:spermidine/putrescine-binding protein